MIFINMFNHITAQIVPLESRHALISQSDGYIITNQLNIKNPKLLRNVGSENVCLL